RRRARGGDRKSRWHRIHIVAMTRPYAQLGRNLLEQLRDSAVTGDANVGVAELSLARSADLSTRPGGHQLHPVADPKHRRPELEELRRALGSAGLGNALWSARQNDSDRVLLVELLDWRVERNDLGVNRQLTQAASDQLRVLRTKIKDEDRLVGHERRY